MYKVLVVGMSKNYGGIENVIFNYYKRFDRTQIHFDFCKSCKQKIAYEDILKKWGSEIFYIPSKENNMFLYRKYIINFFRTNSDHYDCIWVNRNDLANLDYIKLAKKYGIPRRIIHSHNVQLLENSKIKTIMHKLNKERVYKYATDFWACSAVAADWFYPSKIRSKVVIVKNAIDILSFKYNDSIRKELRRKLKLENYSVIGHVGRLGYQKNQKFLIQVFSELVKIKPNTKLVLLGDGNNKDELKELVKTLGLEDKVLFLGMKQKVQNWYNLFDVFVFPSRFEGLGIAALEAQANGLPCLVSKNNIPKDLKINKNFHFLSLDTTKLYWAKKIVDHMNEPRVSFRLIEKNFKLSGYSIDTASKELQSLFLG